MSDVVITGTFYTEQYKEQFRAATLEAVREVFELDIKGRAKELSPVSYENPKIEGSKYRETGNNKNSIDVDVVAEEADVRAWLFSQSGYGGYLEVGTHLMPSRPYLHPAYAEFVGTIPARVREKMNG